MDNLFKDWLSEKLKEKGITVIQLCEDTGLKRSSIYYYMKDINRPRADSLRKICDTLGADINEVSKLFAPKQNGRPVGSGHRYGYDAPELSQTVEV